MGQPDEYLYWELRNSIKELEAEVVELKAEREQFKRNWDDLRKERAELKDWQILALPYLHIKDLQCRLLRDLAAINAAMKEGE